MIVFNPDGQAVVKFELEASRAGGTFEISLEDYLALVKVSQTEAEFRAKLFTSRASRIEWRSEEAKEKRRERTVAAAGL